MSVRSLYRLAAIAGGLAAVVLLVNTAKRAGVIPDVGAVRGVAPLAEVFGLAAVIGLYLNARARAGVAGAVGFMLSFAGLVGVAGVEYILNFVFPAIGPGEVEALRSGLAGTMLTVTSIVFLLGSLTLAVGLWTARAYPAVAVGLYAVGSVPIALRTLFPEGVLQLGLVLLAAGTAWLSVALYRRTSAGDFAAVGTA